MDNNYFRDDLDDVAKGKGKRFPAYICSKCGKSEDKAKSSFNVMGKDLCMDCWFLTDYKAEANQSGNK